MAHLTSAAVWTIDTSATGIVTWNPVFIDSILVTWKFSSAGTLLIQERVGSTSSVLNPILDAISSGASTAAASQMTQQFMVGRIFQNINLTTATNIASLYVYTK